MLTAHGKRIVLAGVLVGAFISLVGAFLAMAIYSMCRRKGQLQEAARRSGRGGAPSSSSRRSQSRNGGGGEEHHRTPLPPLPPLTATAAAAAAVALAMEEELELGRRAVQARPLVCSYLRSDGWQDATCGVCLAELADGDVLRVLPACMHYFHAACVNEWLRAHHTCPFCRGPVATAPPADPYSLYG